MYLPKFIVFFCLVNRACNFIRRKLQQRCFLLKLTKYLRTRFLQETSGGCSCMEKPNTILRKNNSLKSYFDFFFRILYCFVQSGEAFTVKGNKHIADFNLSRFDRSFLSKKDLKRCFLCEFSITNIHDSQGSMGRGISLIPFYHFHPPHRHLDISRAITAEISPLHIASSRTRTGNFWFPSASR